MKEKAQRPIGATILAIMLGWLGIAGLLNAIAWPLVLKSDLMQSAPPHFIERFPPALGSLWLSFLALVYGVTALLAARALWRLSPAAIPSYLAWAATVLLLGLVISAWTPGVPFTAAAMFLLPVTALLAAGWWFIRRLVQR
jgi:hypothetical protein